MVEIGIFARCFRRPDLDGVLDAVVEHGLTAVQLNLACAGMDTRPEGLSVEECSGIRRAFAERGLRAAGLSATFNAIDPVLTRREEMTCRCVRLIQRAPSLGVPLITLCTGSRDPHDKWHWHEDNASPEAWADLHATLARLVPAAESAGVLLGIEPEQGNVVRSARLARRLLDEVGSGHLKIVMDGANLLTQENLPHMRAVLEEAFQLLGPDVVSMHAKDFAADPTDPYPAAGTGRLDFDAYLELAARSGYDGPVILHNVQEAQVPQSVAFVRRLLVRHFPGATELEQR